MIFDTSRYFLKAARALKMGTGSVFYHDFNSISTDAILREDYLIKLCSKQRVLHFGFLDVPFSEEKLKSGQLLHLQLSKVADYLYGIDINEDSLNQYRAVTGDNQNSLFNLLTDNPFQPEMISNFDILLFSEVLEHLPNPFLALQALKNLCEANNGARLCLTVPNAFSFYGFTSALNGIETVHPDHFFYFSPYTLQNICRQAGFVDISLQLYSSGNLLHSPGITKHGVIAVCRA